MSPLFLAGFTGSTAHSSPHEYPDLAVAPFNGLPIITTGMNVYGPWTEIVSAGILPDPCSIAGITVIDLTLQNATQVQFGTGAIGFETASPLTCAGGGGGGLGIIALIITLIPQIVFRGSPRVVARAVEYSSGGHTLALSLTTYRLPF